ncbi:MULTISPECIES: sugar phosphate isomerase/epimerase [unclassified Ruegeria]|uniref:sugar phosphate isomerase/epimerase family protein n=1 Tax=unclassified Ruegeria TaxID=2625375 RepID=UPI0014899A8B|nr:MULTISPECIES: sugar phosphate isomerase/epimerase family protein [unclassified Ruegeria]
MKLAVSNIAWTAEEDAVIAQHLRDAGVDALEVAPSRVFADVAAATSEDALAVKADWAAEGLPIVSMQALLFGQPDLRLFGTARDQDAFVDYLAHVMARAGELGCGPLVFGSPGNRKRGGLSLDQAYDAALPVLRRVAEIAAETGTYFCLEANATGYGCDFMTQLSEAAEMVRRVDHPNMRMVLDTGNMLMAGEDVTAVEPVLPLVQHVHFSAPQLAPIAEHAAFLRQVLSGLKTAGYAGYVTLEMRKTDSLTPLLENLAFLRWELDEAMA